LAGVVAGLIFGCGGANETETSPPSATPQPASASLPDHLHGDAMPGVTGTRELPTTREASSAVSRRSVKPEDSVRAFQGDFLGSGEEQLVLTTPNDVVICNSAEGSSGCTVVPVSLDDRYFAMSPNPTDGKRAWLLRIGIGGGLSKCTVSKSGERVSLECRSGDVAPLQIAQQIEIVDRVMAIETLTGKYICILRHDYSTLERCIGVSRSSGAPLVLAESDSRKVRFLRLHEASLQICELSSSWRNFNCTQLQESPILQAANLNFSAYFVQQADGRPGALIRQAGRIHLCAIELLTLKCVASERKAETLAEAMVGILPAAFVGVGDRVVVADSAKKKAALSYTVRLPDTLAPAVDALNCLVDGWSNSGDAPVYASGFVRINSACDDFPFGQPSDAWYGSSFWAAQLQVKYYTLTEFEYRSLICRGICDTRSTQAWNACYAGAALMYGFLWWAGGIPPAAGAAAVMTACGIGSHFGHQKCTADCMSGRVPDA
jgi:hypothetical protein